MLYLSIVHAWVFCTWANIYIVLNILGFACFANFINIHCPENTFRQKSAEVNVNKT